MRTQAQSQHTCQTFSKIGQNYGPISDFAPCPHFIITLPFMVNFRSKIYFLECKYQGWKKSILKSVSLISNCIFFTKKKFFLQNFCDFWVFLKFRSMVAKSETGTWFFRIFRTFWHLYWPWVCVRIEMGNLEAKTPCVIRLLRLEARLKAMGWVDACFNTP